MGCCNPASAASFPLPPNPPAPPHTHDAHMPQDYKEFLEDMVKPEDKNATPFITDYKEYHTGAVV